MVRDAGLGGSLLLQDKLLDFKLKAPYVPPSSRLIGDAEMEKIVALNIPVTQEIEKTASKFKGRKAVPSVPNWDKEF